MNPLISVIVPIYKVEEYLPKCIDSIINQTYHNLEIILVDDGSPDNCGVICDYYAQQDARIRVVHRNNGGLSAARNSGLDIMQGEYLMFVDSDDWLALDAIQSLYARLICDNSDMVIGQMIKVFADGDTKPSSYAWMKDMVITGQEALSMLGTETPIPCNASGCLMKEAVYQDLRFPKLRRAEDMWIFPHVLDACRKISLDSRIFYFYYQRSTSIIHSSNDAQLLDCVSAAFHVARYLMERELWNNASVYCMSGVMQLLQVKDAKKARKLLRNAFAEKEWLHFVLLKPQCALYVFFLRHLKLYQLMRKLWRWLRRKEC